MSLFLGCSSCRKPHGLCDCPSSVRATTPLRYLRQIVNPLGVRPCTRCGLIGGDCYCTSTTTLEARRGEHP